MYITIAQIREAFWEAHPEFKSEYRTRKRQNDYKADIRQAFVFWLDSIHKNGQISDKLVKNATL